MKITNSSLGITGRFKTGNTGLIATDNRIVKNDLTPLKGKDYILQTDDYFSTEEVPFNTTQTVVKINIDPIYKNKETNIIVLK